MKRLLRNVGDGADRCLQQYPLSTLACVIVVWMGGGFFLLRGITASLHEPQRPMISPAAARPDQDLAGRLERVERRLDEISTIIPGTNPFASAARSP